MIPQPMNVQDWTSLRDGDKVTITYRNGRQHLARVETKMADSSVLWIFDDFGQRRAFDHRDDVEVVHTAEDSL